MKIILFLTIFLPITLAIQFNDCNKDTEFLEMTFGPHKRDIALTLFQDDHLYYTSSFSPMGSDSWMELADVSGAHQGLSDGYYLYTPLELKFRFPFYGHYVQTVALTTHGFLSTADVFHSRIHLTQYIAPFSADFNPTHSRSSKIYNFSTPDLFIAQWSELFLASNRQAGSFTFQVQLRPNGEIKFVYRNIPLRVEQTTTDVYESFSGLSDGYIFNNSNFLYLYAYHSVALRGIDLSGGVYTLTPLPNCISAVNQTECNMTSCESTFQCGWCETIQLCSDGLDRKRQTWIESGCERDAVVSCPLPLISFPISYATIIIPCFIFLVCASLFVASAIVTAWVVYRYRTTGKFMLISRGVKVSAGKDTSEHIVLTEPEDAAQ